MCVNPVGFGPKPCAYFAWPPAVTVNSVRPWKAFSVEITRSLCAPKRSCAQRRASFSAASLASAPELQKNTRSANVDWTSRSASRSAGSLVNQFETCQSLRACSSSARTIAGWQWPSAVTATPLAKSTYMRPSWSQTREPSPRTGRNDAGAKHGTMSRSKSARVTDIVAAVDAATGSRRALAAITALVAASGGGLTGLPSALTRFGADSPSGRPFVLIDGSASYRSRYSAATT